VEVEVMVTEMIMEMADGTWTQRMKTQMMRQTVRSRLQSKHQEELGRAEREASPAPAALQNLALLHHHP
jgi:hypothetical protein